ncbi:MAG: hypothetical protein VKL39_13465 [Leptolyngbyaceae bacterium]|nr:hypothetical protein [Leptolyngbyaceae bacterium]
MEICSDWRVAKEVEVIIGEGLASELSDEMLSLEDFKFLISCWVHFFSHSALYIWFNSSPKRSFSTYNFKNVPSDTGSFLTLCRSETYADYIAKTTYSDQSETILNVEKNNQFIKLVPTFGIETVIYKTQFSRLEKILLAVYSMGRIRSVSSVGTVKRKEVLEDKRQAISEKCQSLLGGFSFAHWLSIRLVEFFPRIYLEEISFYQDLYSSRKTRNKVIFSQDCWSSDDKLKLYSVLTRNNQGQVPLRIGAPHSFNYSCLKNFWFRDYELEYTNVYLSWGWKHKKVIPFYINHFLGQRRTLRPFPIPKDFEIVFTSSSGRSHLTEYPYRPEDYDVYINNHIDLACTISRKSRHRVTLRGRQRDRGDLLEKLLRRRQVSDIKFEYNEGGFRKRIFGCLHICDCLSTSIIDSLFINQPTLIIVSGDYFQVNDHSKSDFQQLAEVGIFHNHPGSLITFLLSKLDNVNDWWCSPETQHAVSTFLAVHYRSGASLSAWARVLTDASVDNTH